MWMLMQLLLVFLLCCDVRNIDDRTVFLPITDNLSLKYNIMRRSSYQ